MSKLETPEQAQARYVRKLVDTFPLLTQDQRARLAVLLSPVRQR